MNGKPTIADILLKVIYDRKTGCWNWAAGKNGKGYGYMTVSGKQRPAHRLAFEAAYTKIPKDLVIDHKCRNRGCVNPEHLRIVTPKQNALENNSGKSAENIVKTHCVNGHEFTPANTIVKWRDARHRHMRRVCRTCQRESWKLYMRRKRGLDSRLSRTTEGSKDQP